MPGVEHGRSIISRISAQDAIFLVNGRFIYCGGGIVVVDEPLVGPLLGLVSAWGNGLVEVLDFVCEGGRRELTKS